MSAGFDLNELTIRILAESDEPNPRLLGTNLVDAIGFGDLKAAIEQAAADIMYLSATRNRGPIAERQRQLALMAEHSDRGDHGRGDTQSSGVAPVGTPGPSRWQTATFGRRTFVPLTEEWKRLGELNLDEVLSIADLRAKQADTLRATSKRWKALHAEMEARDASTVSDLPEERVKEILDD